MIRKSFGILLLVIVLVSVSAVQRTSVQAQVTTQITINFDDGIPLPPSASESDGSAGLGFRTMADGYEEAGFTVETPDPLCVADWNVGAGLGCLILANIDSDSDRELSHPSSLGTYTFSFGGTPFTLIDLVIVANSPRTAVGRFESSKGGISDAWIDKQPVFSGDEWTSILYFTWTLVSASTFQAIDDIVIGHVDADGDGWFYPEDCNDGNDQVNPDAQEVFDGEDNDCDGLIDLDDPSIDYDQDGFSAAEDCNDEDANTYPGAFEWPDGIDNDCDGAVDRLWLGWTWPWFIVILFLSGGAVGLVAFFYRWWLKKQS